MNVQTNVPLAPRTTFRLGGPARHLYTIDTPEELHRTRAIAGHHSTRILGGGSNLLIHDRPLEDIVVSNRIRTLTHGSFEGDILLRAGSGIAWDMLVAYAVRRGWQGIECLSGIPGTVGAAPIQNIGAYGQCIADVIHAVSAIDLETGAPLELDAAACAFGYRTSIFQSRPSVVTEVVLRLHPGAPPTVAYQDLKTHLGEHMPSLAQVRQTILNIRGAKGTLVLPGWPRIRSAGSFFKNPVVSMTTFESCRAQLESNAPDRPWYWADKKGSLKLSAARLIESAGFPRGFRDGPVGTSPHHALALVAYRGAHAPDIIGLARRIQETVLERFGVLLEAEPQLWGWNHYPLLKSDTGNR